MKLSYKFAIMIVSITMLSVIILGILFSIYATNIIKERVSDQLQSISILKENRFNDYVDSSTDELESLASDPLLTGYMEQFAEIHNLGNNANLTLKQEDFLKSTSQNATVFSKELLAWAWLEDSSSSDNLEEFLEDKVVEHFTIDLNYSEFSELSVLTLKGVVDFSTELDEEGKVISKEKYFINGLNSTYVQNFYISVSTREPTMTISTPIYSDEGKVIGVLAGNVRLNRINQIMAERSGLGNTGETILINKNHLLVSESRFMEGMAFKKTIYTEGLKECLEGTGGPKEYKDYRNVDVIGFLVWIPEREVCLVTKIDAKEAYSSLDKLSVNLLIFGFIVIIFSLIMSYFLLRTFTKQITALVEGTEQWAKGNFDYIITTTSNDEIAVLCKAFNDASKEMLQSKELEKNYTKDLKKELEQKTHDMKKNLEELEQSKNASLNIMDDLSETNKHLKDLDKAKTDFLNIASHELKTPLTAISAYLEILDDYKGQFNKGQLQGLDAIKRNSNQLKMLISNILEISRLDSGRFDLNITEINVKEKVAMLVDNLKILSDNKHIVLKHDCDGVEKISTDEMRFEEILNNLIGNAIKFTDKGSVTVKTEWGKDKEKGFVVVSVIDTGVGIAENELNNLFQNFYQIDATISRKYGGTGLGLSITKKMIELQGGKISFSSVVGKGTTFRFTLPIQPSKKAVSDISESIKGQTLTAKAITNAKTSITKSVKFNNLQNNSQKQPKIHPNSKQINSHTSKRRK